MSSQRGAGTEDAGDAHLEQLRDVGFGNDAADQDADVVEAGLAQQLEDARHQRHVGAGEEAQAEPVGVLVGDGADDGFGRLPQAGVDDVHAGVAQGAGHDLDAAVVAVEPDLGEDDADGNGMTHSRREGVWHRSCYTFPPPPPRRRPALTDCAADDLLKRITGRYGEEAMTFQVRERLVHRGQATDVACLPLSSYRGTARMPRIVSVPDDCWRGYVGTWEVRDDALFLTSLAIPHDLAGRYALPEMFPDAGGAVRAEVVQRAAQPGVLREGAAVLPRVPHGAAAAGGIRVDATGEVSQSQLTPHVAALFGEQELAFLRAIRADRADPTPCLVYADWLEEQGELRGPRPPAPRPSRSAPRGRPAGRSGCTPAPTCPTAPSTRATASGSGAGSPTSAAGPARTPRPRRRLAPRRARKVTRRRRRRGSPRGPSGRRARRPGGPISAWYFSITVSCSSNFLR